MLDLKISQYIRIRNHKVELNGEVIYSASEIENTLDFLCAIYRHFGVNYKKFFKMDDLSKLGFLASELLMKDGPSNSLEPDETSIILANSSSSLNTDQKFQKTVSDIPSPATFVYTLPNIVIGEICIRNGFRGENTFFVQQKFDYEQIGNYVRLLFDGTGIKQCLVGWVEMSLDNYYDTILYLVSPEQGKLDFTNSTIKRLYNNPL